MKIIGIVSHEGKPHIKLDDGRLLPVIQGWPFGVAGAAILYVESRWVQRKVRRFRQHNPRFERTWLKARAWMKARRRARKARNSAATL